MLPIVWCHECSPAGTAWVWDNSGKTLSLGNIFPMLSVQDLLRLQNQDTELNRFPT